VHNESVYGCLLLVNLRKRRKKVKKQKGFKKQAGLTLMELVIAIIVAIALGTGGLLIYSDLKGKAQAANKADLGAKVAGAIAVYLGKYSGSSLPSGMAITDPTIMQNATCSGGLVYLKSDPTVTVQLLNESGAPVGACGSYIYGVSA
jgi:hypothetical protein